MKAIIIRGKQNVGKSTTIKEVCKRLKPKSIYKLDISKKEKVEENIDKIQIKYVMVYILLKSKENVYQYLLDLQQKQELILVLLQILVLK